MLVGVGIDGWIFDGSISKLIDIKCKEISRDYVSEKSGLFIQIFHLEMP